MKAVAIGVGYEWGKGMLTMYDGTEHEFQIRGLTLLDVGISSIELEGEVFHLVEAKDLAGAYYVDQAGAALVGGARSCFPDVTLSTELPNFCDFRSTTAPRCAISLRAGDRG